MVIEHLDWREVLAKYDAPETVFYLDPPYVGKEDYYPAGEIDHEALVKVLGDLEGRWLCSYEESPDGLGEYEVLEREERRFINNGKSGSANEARERLVMNFEPRNSSSPLLTPSK